jgi:aspartate dehydrogenase
MVGIGILGAGALGQAIADSICSGSIPGVTLAAIAGRPGSEARITALAERWACRATTDPTELPRLGAGLIVESAGVEAVRSHAVTLLGSGCDLVVMSVGALADEGFASELRHAAAQAGRRVFLPSGAIAGLDGILSAGEAGPLQVRITTRKRPAALAGAPYLALSGIELAGIKAETTIFEGSAREAADGFPANLNVAVTLACAVGDVDAVEVRVIADPAVTHTHHRIEVAARSGDITVELTNVPSATNPRSSWLAALSALATIRRIVSPIWIG